MTVGTEPGTGPSTPWQLVTLATKEAQTVRTSNADSSDPEELGFWDYDPLATTYRPIYDLNDLHEGPQAPDMVPFDSEDEVSELLRMKAQEETLEAWRDSGLDEDFVPDRSCQEVEDSRAGRD